MISNRFARLTAVFFGLVVVAGSSVLSAQSEDYYFDGQYYRKRPAASNSYNYVTRSQAVSRQANRTQPTYRSPSPRAYTQPQSAVQQQSSPQLRSVLQSQPVAPPQTGGQASNGQAATANRFPGPAAMRGNSSQIYSQVGYQDIGPPISAPSASRAIYSPESPIERYGRQAHYFENDFSETQVLENADELLRQELEYRQQLSSPTGLQAGTNQQAGSSSPSVPAARVAANLNHDPYRDTGYSQEPFGQVQPQQDNNSGFDAFGPPPEDVRRGRGNEQPQPQVQQPPVQQQPQDFQPPQLPGGVTDVPDVPLEDQQLPYPGRYPPEQTGAGQADAASREPRPAFGYWPDGQYRHGADQPQPQQQTQQYPEGYYPDSYGQAQYGYQQSAPIAPYQDAYPGYVTDRNGVYQQIVVEPECNACNAFADDCFEYEFGYYLSLFAGLSEIGSLTQNVDDPAVTPAQFDFDDGGGFGIALGAIQGYNMRSEIEFAYRNYDLIQIAEPPLAGEGDLHAYSGMGNVYWEFMGVRNVRFWRPYVGAGVGFMFLEPDFNDGNIDLNAGSTSDSAFAYQFMAGANFKYRRGVDLFVEYRYHAAEEVRMNVAGVGEPAFDFSSEDVFFGCRMKF